MECKNVPEGCTGQDCTETRKKLISRGNVVGNWRTENIHHFLSPKANKFRANKSEESLNSRPSLVAKQKLNLFYQEHKKTY